MSDDDRLTTGIPEHDPGAVYQQRWEAAEAKAKRLAGRSRAFSIARLLTALVGAFLLLQILLEASAPPAWPFLALLAVGLGFAILAVLHSRVLTALSRARGRRDLQNQGLARLDRRWADLPPSPPPPLPTGSLPPLDEEATPGRAQRSEVRAESQAPVQAEVRDLNLFGPASLGRLLSTPRTPAGRRTLGRWLLEPAAPREIRRRHPAVSELAADLELRQDLELAGLLAGDRSPRSGADASRHDSGEAAALENFLTWAEGEPWLLRRRWLIWTSRLMPLLTLGLAVAAIAGAIPGSLAALPPVAALVLTWALRGTTEPLFERVAAGPGELSRYAALLEILAGRRFTSPRLDELAQRMTAERTSAARWMRRLARRAESADSRHGSFHVLNQVITLWDFHALYALERWQVAVGSEVRRWLEALAEVEALAALGTLAWDHPDWTFPHLLDSGSEALLRGSNLGHPLLADAVRVGNDVQVGPPGTVLLVTGSNMSGKSTLLRSLGVNVTLAQAGGPVCADHLELPPLALGTSILVEDSLADGVSFFYAELLRLKQVVDRADELAATGPGEGRTLLYLLDEILRGTNSRERQVAVVRVLNHLMEAGAIGALSTHDLELGSVPEVARAAEQVHFRETLHPPGGDGPRMTFDYQLRSGPATTTNALALLAAVGLDREDP